MLLRTQALQVLYRALSSESYSLHFIPLLPPSFLLVLDAVLMLSFLSGRRSVYERC